MDKVYKQVFTASDGISVTAVVMDPEDFTSLVEELTGQKEFKSGMMILTRNPINEAIFERFEIETDRVSFAPRGIAARMGMTREDIFPGFEN